MQKIHIFRVGIVLSVFYCYANVFLNLMEKWKNEDLYSYGFLIPAISIYLIWLKRNDIRKIEQKPDILIGFVILIAGLFSLVFGYIGSIVLIQELSIIFTITGLVFLTFGKQVFSKIWFPIFYLIFMMPIWDSVLDPLHYPFQYLSASVGVGILKIIGVPVYQKDIFIELPNITLVVASVCSGVNYLISVVAIGIPLSYYYLSSFKRRIFLLLLSVFIAIFSNSLRVGAIGLFAYHSGEKVSQNIHGPFDILRSVIISMVGIIVLFIGTIFLKEKEIDNVPRIKEVSLSWNPATSFKISKAQTKTNYFLMYIISITMVFVIGTFVNFYRHKPVPLKNSFNSLPHIIGRWEGMNTGPFSLAENFKEFGVDQEVIREYRDGLDNVIQLYIGYWDFQVQGKELINYKLDEMLDNRQKYKSSQNTIFIYDEKEYTKENEKTNDIFIYWIDINGRIIGDKYRAKAYNILDFIKHGRTNSAIVLMKVNKKNGEDIDQALDRYNNFIFELSSVLKHYLPDR